MIATTACRHAVKANDHLRGVELASLVRDLMACEMPYCCPHGRPTLIQISYSRARAKIWPPSSLILFFFKFILD